MATAPRAASTTTSKAKRRKPARRKATPRQHAAAAARTADTTFSDIESLRDDVLRLTRNVAALATTGAATARETATELYDTGLDYARDAEGQVRGYAGDVARQVEKNPLAAVGIVFGVGYIIGLLRRR